MAKKNDTKNLFFIAQASKAIPKIERELTRIINQFDLMIKLSSAEVLDGRTLLREANIGMKRMSQLDNELSKTINLVTSNAKKLSRQERTKALVDFRGKVKNLDRKYFPVAMKKARALQTVATKKLKETQVANTSSDPLVMALRVIQALVTVYKYFSTESKKLK